MMVKSFDKMSMLVSFEQPKRIDELIYLQVRKANFSIRVFEIGLSEYFDESSRGYGGKDNEERDLVSERDDTVVSDSESMTRTGPKKALKERQNLEDQASNVISFKKSNGNVGC